MQRLILTARLFTHFSLRHMRHHKGRAITVLVGIALGAAVFTSVRLSVDASLAAFTRSVDLMAGKADRVVIGTGGGVPESLVSRLLRHPAVREASPVMRTYVRPPESKEMSFLLIGIDPILDSPLRFWSADKGALKDTVPWVELIRSPDTFIAGDALLRQFGWHPGQAVRLEHPRQTRTFRIAGRLNPGGLAGVEGGRIAIMDISTFQEFTGRIGVVDRIDIIFAPDADPRSLPHFLPAGTSLSVPSEARRTGKAMIRAYQINLSVLSFASLFVGMFLVYSLVALNAASRRHEIAILRALGASPRTIFRLFLAEGTLLGILGWLAAVPLSAVMVRYLLSGVSQTISTLFVRVHVDQLFLSPLEILASFGLTVCVSAAAAFQPAREAMAVSPKEVMIRLPGTSLRDRPARRLALLGLLLLAGVAPLSALPGLPGLPLPGYMATLLLFVGFALLAPFCLRRFGLLLAPIMARFGKPAYLAAAYVRDSGTRTAISVGALITAVALFVSLVIMVHSFRRTVELWVNQTISGDLFAGAKMADLNGFRDPMPPDIIEALGRLNTPADLVPSRRFSLKAGGFPYQLEAMTMAPFFRRGDFIWIGPRSPELVRRLLNGDGVVVSEVFANRTGLGAGDTYRARVGEHRLKFPILGVIRDYRTQGGVVFVEMDAVRRLIPGMGWTGVRFYLRDPSTGLEPLRQELIGCCGDRLEMISGRSLRGQVLKIFDETFAVTTVLLIIALIVAALGITTTMTVRVLERSHQLHTIMAVGGALRQIRTMILWESTLLVVAGETAGLLCGFLLSYLLIFVINRQSFGWTFIYGVDWAALAVSIPLIVTVSLSAAVPALREVFRKPPATLLRQR